MKSVVFCCPFVPMEWIAAHGLRPCRVMPTALPSRPQVGSETHPPAGMCPYAHAYALHVSREEAGGGIVFTTTCDQMRRVPEWLSQDECANTKRPVFLMHVPTTWNTVQAQRLYRSELRRLGRFLETLGGAPPTRERLASVMAEFDRQRVCLRDARSRLSARQFAEALAQFHAGQPLDLQGTSVAARSAGIPVALVGSPLMRKHLGIMDLIETAGGEVVLDATGAGELALLPPFDRRCMHDDPFEVLADTYFNEIPDAFRRPNNLLYQYLKNAIKQRDVRGVIFRCYLWCDTWHAEAQRVRDWAPIPTLILDAEEQDVDQRTVSRIQAFIEVLK